MFCSNYYRYILSGLLLWASISIADAQQRIITLSNAITETVYALGGGSTIVATDVTSISPQAAAKLPRVSKNRSVSAEGLLAYRPTVIVAPDGDIPVAVIQQVRRAGVKLVTVRQEYSVKGALAFIQDVADAIDATAVGKKLVEKTKVDLTKVQAAVRKKTSPKVLFIYARGTGTMSVAGKGSSLDAIISLAGGQNAVKEFADFKPYMTEALVSAKPDIILMFDFGMSSLGGKDAILKMPGVRITEAGKHKRILAMDPSLLVNFSSRLPEAITALHKAIEQEMAK
jgi:iron complex transport system substrate-binding protein